jgi:acetyl-CoA synthetase
MTRGFWNEPERYLETYWDRFPDTWVHGDWASIDEDGFWFLHGRSDDTLNIAGKRIGPAEIESVVVALPEVVMAAAIGIPDPVKGEAIALYVVPAPGVEIGEAMRARVETAVTETLGKTFRPAVIRMVADLPRTRSAKIMRRVVKALALGHDIGDLSSLENPESLEGIAPLA